MDAMLELKNVETYYGPIMAIRGVSMEVPEGKIVSLLGANGAGKTTTLRALTGMVTTEGSVLFEGSEIRGKGLIIGAELDERLQGKAGDLTEACRVHGVLVLQAGPDVLRFLPPLNITDEELDEGLDRFAQAITEAAGSR